MSLHEQGHEVAGPLCEMLSSMRQVHLVPEVSREEQLLRRAYPESQGTDTVWGSVEGNPEVILGNVALLWVSGGSHFRDEIDLTVGQDAEVYELETTPS